MKYTVEKFFGGGIVKRGDRNVAYVFDANFGRYDGHLSAHVMAIRLENGMVEPLDKFFNAEPNGEVSEPMRLIPVSTCNEIVAKHDRSASIQ